MSILVLPLKKLVALPLLSYRCIFTINVLWLFLTVLWAGLQCVIVVFPDQTHLLFDCQIQCWLENSSATGHIRVSIL